MGRDGGDHRQSGAANGGRMTKLPEAEWRSSTGLKRVVEALSGDAEGPRIVGGAVRDCLFGLPVSDVDLATPIEPRAVIDRLESAGIKAIPTGIDHGTITAVADGNVFEITTLRRDVSTDGRRATVAFSSDWKEDAARRDFTINALYADPDSGEIFDYFGGLADLENRCLRFIGDADERIAEDHLRILRYFRFLARFGDGKVDDVAIAACAAGASKLMALSRERIASELMKILSLPDPVDAVSLMIEHGIFAPFLPELSDNAAGSALPARAARAKLHPPKRAYDKIPRIVNERPRCRRQGRDAAQAIKPDAARYFSTGERHVDIATSIGARLCLPSRPGNRKRRGNALCERMPISPTLYHSLNGWQVPSFSVKGGEIIKLGLKAGPIVAKTLHDIKTAWIEEGFPGPRAARCNHASAGKSSPARFQKRIGIFVGERFGIIIALPYRAAQAF